MKSVEVVKYLKSNKIYGLDLAKLKENIEQEKKDFLISNDQDSLFKCWFALTSLEIVDKYKKAFNLLKSRRYKAAWDIIEQVEISLSNIEFNDIRLSNYPVLENINDKISKFQKIYPYRLYISPEILNKKVECSICGSDMNPFYGCDHLPGKVYNGDMCLTIIRDAEFVGTSIVKNPVQKYSALYDDIENPERYQLLEYLVPKLKNEKIRWDFIIKTKYHSHSEMKVGRNEKCPCQSGKKYKHCCKNVPEGIKYPHYEFIIHDNELLNTTNVQQVISPEIFSAALQSFR